MSLIAQDIRVTIGRKEILRGVNIQAEPGQITALLGPNGSGKSTFLKAITGEHKFTGSVSLNGSDLGRMKPWQMAAMRAVLPQSSNIAFPFTVSEIVQLGLSQGIDAARSDLPARALERVDLSGYGPRLYQELSGGEQQRVQLARALVQVWDPVVDGTPRWLFLDEPVSSLDIAHQFTVMEVMQDYAANGGGVLAIMHDINLTALYADQIAMLKDGALLIQSTPDQVVTDSLLSRAYDLPIQSNTLPAQHVPYVLPQASARTQSRP